MRVYAQNFETALAVVLAHSVVFFVREEFSPGGVVNDAVNSGKNESSQEETVTQQQTAAQGGGAGSNTLVAGAQSQGNGEGNISNLARGTTIGKGGSQTINIETPDDNAIAAVQATAHDALSAMAATAGDSENVSFASEALAAQALQQANEQQISNASSIESLSATYAAGLSQAASNAQITANNAETGQTQDLGYGLTQPDSSTGASKAALWITIAAGLAALWFYFFKGKKS